MTVFADTLKRLNRAARYEQAGVNPTQCQISRKDLLDLIVDWEQLDKKIRSLEKPAGMPVLPADKPITAAELADAFEAFWNPSIEAARENSDFTTMQTVGAIAQGFAAVAVQLREVSLETNGTSKAWVDLRGQNALLHEQCEWLKARLASLQLPAGKSVDEWLSEFEGPFSKGGAA